MRCGRKRGRRYKLFLQTCGSSLWHTGVKINFVFVFLAGCQKNFWWRVFFFGFLRSGGLATCESHTLLKDFVVVSLYLTGSIDRSS